MPSLLDAYAEVAGADAISHLRQLSERLRGLKVVHVNSTRVGGGVAEILEKLVPLMGELGMDVVWEVITGEQEFYQCTKNFHNALQGRAVQIPERQYKVYEETGAANAERLRPLLQEADVVFVHDPQPAPLLSLCPQRRGKWIWRCHIDVSHPYRPVWKYLRRYLAHFDASVFSLAAFAQALPHPPDSHRTINAIQRAADMVLQKSTREGFGLTVTEALWKGKPVIGGDTGGIRLQVVDHHTGFLVNTPEGAALRIRYLLHHHEKMREMGAKAVQFVRENFLLTRQLREYLTLIVALVHGMRDRIVLE